MPPAKRGPRPVTVSRETRAIAAVERRKAKRPHRTRRDGRFATAGLPRGQKAGAPLGAPPPLSQEGAPQIPDAVASRGIHRTRDFNAMLGGDLIRRFEKHLSDVGHVQVAAVPTRHEPDEGEVNYPAIFDVLDRAGYNGWVGCEYRPRARTEDGLGWARPYGIEPLAK